MINGALSSNCRGICNLSLPSSVYTGALAEYSPVVLGANEITVSFVSGAGLIQALPRETGQVISPISLYKGKPHEWTIALTSPGINRHRDLTNLRSFDLKDGEGVLLERKSAAANP